MRPKKTASAAASSSNSTTNSRRLVDEKNRFEIFPNGHSHFLTKKAVRELQEGMTNEINRCTLEPVNLIAKPRSIPEPTDRFGQGKRIVTLRLRALEGKKLPDLFEGDFISGTIPGHDKKASSSKSFLHGKDPHEFIRASGYREFRILEVFWGTKLWWAQGMTTMTQKNSNTRSFAENNAYVTCEEVI